MDAPNERQPVPEDVRLERLWAGEFGDEYLDRNRTVGDARAPFWKKVLNSIAVTRTLEVGCNAGANLHWLAEQLGSEHVYGVDISLKALAALRFAHTGINAVRASGRDLPFGDRQFDLVFTAGVLIHQPDLTLPVVMSEIVRCSTRYVLCAEYYAEQPTEVPYRGQKRALFKRNYGRLYSDQFPCLQLIHRGFLSRADGWDDVTWWLFERG